MSSDCFGSLPLNIQKSPEPLTENLLIILIIEINGRKFEVLNVEPSFLVPSQGAMWGICYSTSTHPRELNCKYTQFYKNVEIIS